jgi:hypothetical protein
VEALEDRSLLSAFATIQGEISTPAEEDVFPIRIDPADIALHRWGTYVGFEVHASNGSQLDPSPVRIRPLGKSVTTIAWKSSDGPHGSVTLATVRAGSFQLVVGGDRRTTGAYHVNVFLVGDANGDYRVDKRDVQLVHALSGKRLGQASYVRDADANRDGVINAMDEVLTRRNLKTATQIRPLTVTLSIDPAADPDGDGVVQTADITLVGLTAPGTKLRLDQGADGVFDQQTSTSLSGHFQFNTTIQEGQTPFRVESMDLFGQRATAELEVTGDVFRLDVQLDSTGAVSQPIGPAGGTLITTGSNGATYSLVIPPGALVSQELVTMTPVAAIPNLPISEGLIAAAHFGPEGLQFLEPATLTIQMPAGVDASLVVGFGFQDAGDDFYLTPAAVNGSIITLGMNHFTNQGAGQGVPDIGLAIRSFRTRYLTHIRPDLMAAHDLSSLHRAVTNYITWRTDVTQTELVLTDPTVFLQRLSPLRAEGDRLATRAIQTAVGLEMQECDVAPDLQTALGHIRSTYATIEPSWWRRANELGVDTAANGLDLQTLRTNATHCVSINIYDTDFLRSPTAGQPAQLTIRAGLSVAGQFPPQFVSGIIVDVERSSGIQETSVPRQLTDGQGNAVFNVHPVSDTIPSEFDVVARFTTLGNTALVEQRIRVIDDVVRISPSSATLAPGGTQLFTASEAVTWSATGGTISNSGLFTAGSAAGNFTVTATSVANPSRRGQASVQIQGDIAGLYSGILKVTPSSGQPYEAFVSYIVDPPVGTHVVIRRASGAIAFEGTLPTLTDGNSANPTTINVSFGTSSMDFFGSDANNSFVFSGKKM